jgi:hypothetical protein
VINDEGRNKIEGEKRNKIGKESAKARLCCGNARLGCAVAAQPYTMGIVLTVTYFRGRHHVSKKNKTCKHFMWKLF